MGHHTLAAGTVAHDNASGNIRQNMPDPIPVMVQARLAVNPRAQGLKLGAALLQDILQRSLPVTQHTGVCALLPHALNDKACAFYEHYGFRASPPNAMILMMRLPQLA